MSDKKHKILDAALDLFANEGYTATSTSKIAQKAGVSEGLIFRHFESKKGLLHAIMQEAEDRLRDVLADILCEKDPRGVIRKTIELPFNIRSEEYDYWRLQYKLKWDKDYYNPDKMKPLIEKLKEAFALLGFEESEQEARLLSHVLEAVSIELLRGNMKDPQQFKSFLLEKYKA